MKKLLLVPIIIGFMAGCNNSNSHSSYSGVNAEILEINQSIQGMVVKGIDENSVLGESCYINCESEEVYFIFADNSTGDTLDLSFDDFVVGDIITVDVNTVENSHALTSRVQLLTQQ